MELIPVSQIRRTTRALLPGLAAGLLASACLGQSTWYVSPDGSDSADGLTPGTAWKTAAKVNGTSFAPGDQILFERGGLWRETLQPASDGTVAEPIIFGAYGNGEKPRFSGAEVLENVSFEHVAGTSSTYTLPSETRINWVFRNGQFMRSAEQATRPWNTYVPNPDEAVCRGYVDATPGSFYYSSADEALYINIGDDITASTDLFTGSVRAGLNGGAIYVFNRSHLIFRDLAGEETAHWNGGYVFRTMNAANISFENCDAYNGGKHHFGAINTKAFVGRNLYSSGGMPDMWYGAATALVSYSDTNNGRSGDTSEWIDCTVEDYPALFGAFYMHGGGLSDVLLEDIISRGNWIGSGPSGTTTVRVIGGLIENNQYGSYGGNNFVDGLTLVGPEASIKIWGNDSIIQNCLIVGALPIDYQVYPDDSGVILDRGQNNTFRFNTIVMDPATPANAAAFTLYNADAGLDPLKNPTPHIYGNIVSGSAYVFKSNYAGDGSFQWNHNFYTQTPIFTLGDGRVLDLTQWKALGYDMGSLVGNPLFAGDYSLLPGSDAVDGVPVYVDAPISDILGNWRPAGNACDMGAFEFNPEPWKPVARDDVDSVHAESSILVDVLGNDSDDGLPAALVVTEVSTPQVGTAVISGNQIEYTPATGFYGTDVLRYTISDSQDSDQATLTIDVTYMNDNAIWLPLDQAASLDVLEAGGRKLGSVSGFANSTDPWVEGYSGMAVALNGSSQFISLDAAYTPPTGSSARTVTAWIKTVGEGAIVSWGDAGSGNCWTWRLEETHPNAGALRIDVEGGYLVASTDLRDDQWHHVAVVLPDGADTVSQCQLYVDGVLDTPTSFIEQTINTVATPVRIGKDALPTPRYFAGAIDEVRITKRALNPVEIATEAALGNQVDIAWHRAFFGPDPVDWDADADMDGFNRLMEMGLGGNPHLSDPALIQPVFSFDEATRILSVTFRRRNQSVYPLDYAVSVSPDLVDWSSLTSSEQSSPLIDRNQFLENATFHSDRPLAPGQRQFIQVGVWAR
jgi:hypothetical protein